MKKFLTFFSLAFSFMVTGCGGSGDSASTQVSRGTPVTVASISEQRVEVLEQSTGTIEAPKAPSVAAETSGRVTTVLADAGMEVDVGFILARLDDEVQKNRVRSARANAERLTALVENQKRTVARYSDLVLKDSVPENLLDDATSQHAALSAQLEEARAQLATAERDLQQTILRSPLAGIVQAKRVSVGDFVTVGQPLFDIVASDRLRIVVTFPETLSNRLRIGQKTYARLVRATGDVVEGTVTELRPRVGINNRAVDLIVNLDESNGWRPGSAAIVSVVLDVREKSLTVPSESVVRRPAGTVVYTVVDGVAHQNIVEIGVRTKDWTEIVSGLERGDIVVRDGAGFLTDGAAVDVREDRE